MSFLAALARRLALAAPTLLAATMVVFVLLMVGPDPLALLEQEAGVDTAQLAERNGWDRPWPVQYLDWLGGFVSGDLGTSVRTDEPAARMVLDRVPITLALGLASTLLSLLLAVPLALWAARRRGTGGDQLATGAMVALGAVPAFLVALALQWAAVQLRQATGITFVHVGGMPRDGGLVEWVQRFALPVLVLTLGQVAIWMRFQRSELIDALGSEVMVAARGRGLPERTLLLRHGLRRALAPLVTLVALELGTLLGGTIVVETVFGLPGLGRLLVDSLQAKDIVVVLDIVAFGAIALVVATAVADVLVERLDPRVAEPT